MSGTVFEIRKNANTLDWRVDQRSRITLQCLKLGKIAKIPHWRVDQRSRIMSGIASEIWKKRQHSTLTCRTTLTYNAWPYLGLCLKSGKNANTSHRRVDQRSRMFKSETSCGQKWSWDAFAHSLPHGQRGSSFSHFSLLNPSHAFSPYQ